VVHARRDFTAEAIAGRRKADVAVLFWAFLPAEGEECRYKVQGLSGGDRSEHRSAEGQEDLMQPWLRPELYRARVAQRQRRCRQLGDAIYQPLSQRGTPARQPAQPSLKCFWDYNPAGRLPVTFYKSTDQMPRSMTIPMKERTYSTLAETAVSVRHGLSYTTFEYRIQSTQVG